MLDKIAEAWVADGDVVAASDELKASGGVKMKLKSVTSSAGRSYYDVEIVD